MRLSERDDWAGLVCGLFSQILFTQSYDMKKSLLLTVTALCCATAAQAQLTTHNFENATWIDNYYEEEHPAGGQFNKVSGNGQFAVGCDDACFFSDFGGAFLWRRSAPEDLEFISLSTNRVSAQDVSNDGVVVGSFEEREDPETEAVTYPGWRTLDGTWHQLPLPENYSMKQAKTNGYFAEEGRAITPDGKYIAGNAHLVTGTKEVAGMVLEQVQLCPMLWEKSGDSYILKEVYNNVGKAGKSYTLKDGQLTQVEDSVQFMTFMTWDISNDGTLICGMNTAETGGQNPALIRNGVLIQPFMCDYDENFNGGIFRSIDAQGNAYGYFADNEGNYKFFAYTPDDKVIFYDDMVSCATQSGDVFGQTHESVPYVMDCSEDGQVVAGYGIGVWEQGQYAYPVLASNDNPTSINDLRTQVGVDLRAGGQLYINGEYTRATVYNVAGVEVARVAQGQPARLASQPAGTYVVKVVTPQGERTFKVAK